MSLYCGPAIYPYAGIINLLHTDHIIVDSWYHHWHVLRTRSETRLSELGQARYEGGCEAERIRSHPSGVNLTAFGKQHVAAWI